MTNFKVKILIVDDEEKARLYLANILTEMYPTFDIQLSSSPKEATFLIHKQQYDIIFLDVEMPGITGLDMLASLQDAIKSTSIIFISAYKEAEFIQKAIRLRAIDYIDKPVDPEILDKAIKEALSKGKTSTSSLIHNEINGERFCLLTDLGERFTEPAEITHFETAQRYSIAYFTDGSTRIIRDNLTNLAQILPTKHFLHVSRQYIANIRYITYISKSNKTITLNTPEWNKTLDRIYPHVFVKLLASQKEISK